MKDEKNNDCQCCKKCGNPYHKTEKCDLDWDRILREAKERYERQR